MSQIQGAWQGLGFLEETHGARQSGLPSGGPEASVKAQRLFQKNC